MDASCSTPRCAGNGWTTIEVGGSCQKIEYYPEVNALLCYHQTHASDRDKFYLDVLEITTGQVLKTYPFENSVDHLYSMLKQKKILIGSGNILGFTREIGGCLYLDSCLQLPISSTTHRVIVEFSNEEAKLLQPWFEMMKQFPGLTESVLSSVETVLGKINEAVLKFPVDPTHESLATQNTNFAKKAKWQSVKVQLSMEKCLELMESLFSFRFFKKKSLKDPKGAISETSNELSTCADFSILPVLFAIIDRLAALHPTGRQLFLKLEELVSKEVDLDLANSIGIGGFVAGMCSEYARRLTFITWPHFSYKWAKPDSMAKAGFYHTKGAHNGKDGVQCFKCKINLVKWEASDEPWNEHEQHSPDCLFLKGEPTHNVSITNTIAFSPAVKSSDEKRISVISNSNHPFFIATSSTEGSVNIWNCCAVPKLYFNFSIDVTDDQITNIFASYSEPQSTLNTKAMTAESIFQSFFKVEEVNSDPTTSLVGVSSKPSSESAENPKITFPPEETLMPPSSGGFVEVTSLALSGFAGINPSPFGCLIIVGCKIGDPNCGGCPKEKETCLLVYKVDASDIRAVRNALFNLPPDHTNLLVMDDKFSNFASEIAASLPLNSTITDEMMMISDMNDEAIHMEIELAQSPEIIEMTNDPLSYASFVSSLKTANVYDSEALSTSADMGGSPNKLFNLLDAKLMQALPLMQGTFVTHILTEQYGSQPFVYVITSKETHSCVYIFELDRVFNSFKYSSSSNTGPKNLLKMICNQQYAHGIIKHVLLLPAWSFNSGENPLFDESQATTEVASVLLCVSDVDDIILYKLPKLECVNLQVNADKHLFSGAKIKSVSFDCGSDCLCVLTNDGKVHFIELKKLLGDHEDKGENIVSGILADETDSPGISKGAFGMSSAEISRLIDYVPDRNGVTPELNTATLDGISQMSECVALTPRYNTTIIPPGWIEIEQEQQQRKLSEHLPRGGSSVMHTRTFRVHKDTTCRAMIELSLPFTVVLGHVDVKLQLKSTPPCDLSATLYRPITELSTPGSKEGAITENEKLVGPVPLGLFRFGQQGLSVSVSLTGPTLYLTRQRVILLELSSQYTSTPLNLHEVSITLRKTKRPVIQRTLSKVKTILEDQSLVEKLLNAVTNPETVKNVGNTLWFFMGQPTIRQTALISLTWLLYTHSTDSRNSQEYLKNFYSCCSGSKLKELVRACFILGDRTVAHLFARFLATLLKFIPICPENEASVFYSSLKSTLLDFLPGSVTCKSQGGMHWFQLFFYSVVVARTKPFLVFTDYDLQLDTDPGTEKPFKAGLELLDYLVTSAESSQDIYIKTLQNKFRLFCNPFEQRIFTIPMQSIISHDSPKTQTHSYLPGLMGNKWYMPPGTTGAPMPGSFESHQAPAMKTAETLNMMISRKWSGPSTGQVSNTVELSSQSFADLFVPLNFVGFTQDNQLIGFLESEPLRFSCLEASEGVKMQEVTGGIEIGHSQTLVDYEETLNEPGMSPTLVQLINMANANTTNTISTFNSFFNLGWGNVGAAPPPPPPLKCPTSTIQGFYGAVGSNIPGKSYAEAAKAHSLGGHSQNRNSAPMSDAIVGSIGGSLTHTPQPQYMLIENLLAGGRKHVVLDFGRTIMLTDLYIGPCADLASITLDCWIKGEAVDSLRVATSLDICNEALAMSDIQPALYCRYLKIKVIGRYGMPPNGQNKVSLPINTFYGHTLDYEYEMISKESKVKAIGELQEKHLKTLAIVHDDLLCRYSLASNHLKSLIKPHSASLACNSLEEKKFISEVCSNCRVLQRQLNVVTRVIERVKSQYSNPAEVSVKSHADTEEPLSSASSAHVSHSTRFILLSMLELSRSRASMLAYSTHKENCPISEDQCKYFLNQLCIKGLPNNGILALTLLHKVCHVEKWWPDFISSTFIQFFSESSTPELQLHVVKVYITLLHLAKQYRVIDQVILSFVLLLLNGKPGSNSPIVPPVSRPAPSGSEESFGNPMFPSSNCNWSQLSAILMIISQGMSERRSADNPAGQKSSQKWDFFPSILNADFLKSGAASSDKGKCNGKKKDPRMRAFPAPPSKVSSVSLSAMLASKSATAREKPGPSASRVEKSKKAKSDSEGPPKGTHPPVNDVRLPFKVTQELITRLLCVLPEVIRSQATDFVILLCRVVSLLTSACETSAPSQQIRVAQLFPSNLLSNILLNAFVVTTNQLITYAVQSLITDIIEAELGLKATPKPFTPSSDETTKQSQNIVQWPTLTDLFSAPSKYPYNPSPQPPPGDSKASTKMKNASTKWLNHQSELQELYNDPNVDEKFDDKLGTAEYNIDELLISGELNMKNNELLHELLNPTTPPYCPIFGQSQHYKKNVISSSSKSSKEVYVPPERNGDCLDLRLESGILHHSERWLNQLQSAYTGSVYKNLACLNFNPPKKKNYHNANPASNRSRPEAAPSSTGGVSTQEPMEALNSIEDTNTMMRNVFDELLSPRNLPYLDLKEVLLCWFHISNLRNEGHDKTKDASSRIALGLSSENMAQIFNKLTVENTSDSVVWTLLFKCLSSACWSNPPDADSYSTIIVKNLIQFPVLDTFLSGSWSPGGTRAEQCRGPSVTNMFGKFLGTLDSSTKDRLLLGQLYMKLLKSMCEFSGAIKQGYGPVDCQIELVNRMLEFSCQTHDPKLTCALVNVICKLGYDYISRYRNSVSITASSSIHKANPPNICLTVFGSGMYKDNPKSKGVRSSGQGACCRETLLKQLFKLAQKLMKSKMGMNVVSSMPSDRTVADFIVCDDQLPVINTLLVTLSACVLPLGASESLTNESWSVKQMENFAEEQALNEEEEEAQFENRTLADFILQLLVCLETNTKERKVLHQRLVQSLNSSGTFPPAMSQAILCFFLHLLKNIDEVKMFASVGGIQVLINKIISNSETGPGFNFSWQPLNVLQKLTKCFEVDSLELQPTDLPKNIGPKAAISCTSDATAQLPDVLLQENPPHKRARSAAWTYHFPGEQNSSSSASSSSEQSCTLTITLPVLSIVHYVEIKLQTPTMGVSHNLPSSVSLELYPNRDSLADPPSCVTAPLIVGRAAGSSSSNVQLRPHEPQLCGSLLLNFYPPPDSTSIGLSHIAVYARPVLSDISHPCSATDHLLTSLHAFKLIEHCMESQLQNISKRQSSFPTMAPASEALMMGSIFSESFTSVARDRLLSACLSLLAQNTAQSFFPCLKRTVLCLATVPMPVTSSETGQLEQQREMESQSETIQHVIVILLNSFVSSSDALTGVYVDEVLDLLFSLCTHEGSQQVLLNRISVLVSWLEANLATITQTSRQTTACIAHLIHAIASILWQVHALYMSSVQSASTPLVVPSQHFSNVCRSVLDSGCTPENNISTSSVLKKAFDWILCAYVHMYPSFLKILLRLLGCPDLQTQETLSGSSGGPMSPPSPIPIFSTDDNKQQKSYLCKQWWDSLNRNQLATLHHCLLDARALDVFRNFAPVAEMFSLLIDLSQNDESTLSSSENNVKTLIRLLEFLTNISENNPQAKRWLGQAEKTRFWSPLLTSLCYDRTRQQCLDLTDAALKFFETVVDDNTNNQRNLAEIVSQLISQKKDALNSFVKQLILNVFLKEERVVLVVNSTQDKILKWPSFGTHALGHPKYGIGHRVVYAKIDTDATMESLIAEILDPALMVLDPLPYGSASQKPKAGSDSQTVGKIKKSGKTSSSIALYSPLSQKLSKIDQKKKTLEKMFSTKKHWAKYPNSYLTAKMKAPQKMVAEQGSAVSIGGSQPSAPVLQNHESKLWRCVHKKLESDWLPSSMTFRQLLNCLKQLQSRDVEDGYIKVDLLGINSDQFEEMEMVIAETLDSMMDTSFGSQTLQSMRPPQVFASVGGFTKLALRIPVLNPDFVKLMCSTSKDSGSGSSAPGSKTMSGFPGSEKLDLSEWILIDQMMFGPGVSAEGPKSGYNNLIDVETSDEENYSSLDWAGESASDAPHGTTASGNGAPGASGVAVVAPHCLALLGLTLQLPLYVEVLLREERKARFLLRILLGVSDVGDSTTSILSTPEGKNLSTLPLEALKSLFDEYPVNTELGLVIRQQCVDAQILDLLFGCLAVLTHRHPENPYVKSYQFLFPPSLFGGIMSKAAPQRNVEKFHQMNQLEAGVGMKQQPQYWAKGTGFGTGSMQSGWNMEQSFLKKSFEEQNCCAILQVLAAFISGTEKSSSDFSDNKGGDGVAASTSGSSSMGVSSGISPDFTSPINMFREQHMSSAVHLEVDLYNFSCRMHDLIAQSCLLEVLNSYLNNDSVLDISRHVAVYQAVLDVIRSMVTHQETANELVHLLEDSKVDSNLKAIRNCVNSYTSQLSKNLKLIANSGGKDNNGNSADAEETEGINRLSGELDRVYEAVENARTARYYSIRKQQQESAASAEDHDAEVPASSRDASATAPSVKTPAEIYREVMKPLQFQSSKMIKEGSGKNLTFSVPYHFLTEAKMAADSLNTKRAKRLAQESVTLSSALPLDYSSSVFIRYDEDRLDVMKVLITGPSDTPYANGCFIFDIFFPADYPNSPLLCNFTTTGAGTIRFNPNLYNDGKVCLSILNTWHGRPEEKWNAQTSNLLQVLVSIQSLILVSEPYFNEPGYERSRNTPAGQQSSDEYSANIKQATVKWAMLNQLKNPCPCFKDVIQAHFFLKRGEVLKQIHDWLNTMEVMDKNKRYGKKLANHVASLKKSSILLCEELKKLTPPPGLDSSDVYNVLSTTSAATPNQPDASVNRKPSPPSSGVTQTPSVVPDDLPTIEEDSAENIVSEDAELDIDMDATPVIYSLHDLHHSEMASEISDVPQSPTSKAASELLNSVLDVVFWSPSVAQSAGSSGSSNPHVTGNEAGFSNTVGSTDNSSLYSTVVDDSESNSTVPDGVPMDENYLDYENSS